MRNSFSIVLLLASCKTVSHAQQIVTKYEYEVSNNGPPRQGSVASGVPPYSSLRRVIYKQVVVENSSNKTQLATLHCEDGMDYYLKVPPRSFSQALIQTQEEGNHACDLLNVTGSDF